MNRWQFLALFCGMSLIAADLPVREVVLYKHGVGYFARGGVLGAGETARLDFRPGEMNDVLKSLTIQERGGGKISGVRYDADIPLAEKLKDFPFALKEGQALSAVLDQLKGARVEMQFGSEKVSGLIVAARVMRPEEKGMEREQATLLLDNGDLRNFDLGAAAVIRFSDPKLQSQFKEYLMAVTAARTNDRRSVYIDSTGKDARDLVASYVIPTPIWKSSYRLMLDAAGAPMLEGWAIVDNTTGEDWTNVRISLVSGKPISFVSQLYQPRKVARPTADLPELAALAPVIYGGAVGSGSGAGMGTGSGGGVGGALFTAPSAGLSTAEQFMRTDGTNLRSSNGLSEYGRLEAAKGKLPHAVSAPSDIAAAASGREAADLFEYSIGGPVTVHQNESAMLPFLQARIGARKLLIYSATERPNPLNAVEITNSTGMTLDGGPITVSDGGVYAGEALMETVKNGDRRFISYGVDLGTRVTTAFESEAGKVREVRASRGMLTVKLGRIETTTYQVRNVDPRAKTLIVERPVQPGYAVVSPQPVETTTNAWRFRMELPANGPARMQVVQRTVWDQELALTDMTAENVGLWSENEGLAAGSRRALEGLRDLKARRGAVGTELSANEHEILSIGVDEERARHNIATLTGVSGQQEQVQTYARQLAQFEGRITALRSRNAELEKQKVVLDTQIRDTIEKMEF